jgi:hypothetical protein
VPSSRSAPGAEAIACTGRELSVVRIARWYVPLVHAQDPLLHP